jgi:hypothetical protein
MIAAHLVVAAPAERVFAILADPSSHQAIDGTGWVRAQLDGGLLTGTGQEFRMAMYFDNPAQPDNHYEVVNTVRVFDPPRAVAWEPGQDGPDGTVQRGGWIWRYDLTPTGDGTEVTLTYDWSAVGAEIRAQIRFPPFEPSHLENSLRHLAGLATSAAS